MSNPYGSWPGNEWGSQPAPPNWSPQPPPPKRGRGVLFAAVGVMAIVVIAAAVGVGWMLGRSGDDTATAPASLHRSDSQAPESTESEESTSPEPPPSDVMQCAGTATDAAGDTVLWYEERGEYNRSDILSMAVECVEDEVTVTLLFGPEVDMSLAGFAALIDRDPDAGMQGGHACDGSDTDDFSLAVDGSAAGDVWVLLDKTSCETPYPVMMRGTTITEGQQMSATVPLSPLGITSGDTVTISAFSSTFLPPDLIDPGQDDIPDGPPIRITIE